MAQAATSTWGIVSEALASAAARQAPGTVCAAAAAAAVTPSQTAYGRAV